MEKEFINLWQGSNEIERIRDDGNIIYKSNRVNSDERQQIGIYGLKWFSNNLKFCVVYMAHEDEDFNLGLVDVQQQKILFRIKLQRPHHCRVSNNGIIVCEDWGIQNNITCNIYILDINGDILLNKKHNVSLGDTFELIENESKFKYNLNYSGRVKIIELLKITKP